MPSSGLSTPSPYATPVRGDFHDTLAQRLLVASPRSMHTDVESDGGETPGPNTHNAGRIYEGFGPSGDTRDGQMADLEAVWDMVWDYDIVGPTEDAIRKLEQEGVYERGR